MRTILFDYLFLAIHLIGWLLMFAALFLDEKEDGQIQNKVEEWWIVVACKQDESRSRVATFMQELARLIGQGFDAVFGPRLLSLRVAVVSIYLSLASMFLLIIFGFHFIKNKPATATFGGAVGMFLLFASLAVFPAFTRNKWIVGIWWALIPITLLRISGFLLFVAKTRGPFVVFKGIGLVAIVFGSSLVCDLVYIAITRFITRRISGIDHISQILLMIFADVCAMAFLTAGPVYMAIFLTKFAAQVAAMVFVSLMLNTVDLVVALLLLALALLLLLHRLFWPFVRRPLYAFHRFAPIKNKKWLFGIGVVLAFLPKHLTSDVLKAVLEKL